MKKTGYLVKRILCVALTAVFVILPCMETLAETTEAGEVTEEVTVEVVGTESEEAVEITEAEESTEATVDAATAADEPIVEYDENPENGLEGLESGSYTVEDVSTESSVMYSGESSSDTIYVLGGKTYDISKPWNFTVSTSDGLTVYADGTAGNATMAIITGTYTRTDAPIMARYITSTTKYVYCDFSLGNCTTINKMFSYTSANQRLTEIYFGKNFDSSKVTNMSDVFRNLEALKKIDFSGFSTESARDMSFMFVYLPSITDYDLSGFDTSNVTKMNNMFGHSYFVPDLTSFDTSNVTDVSYMFNYCEYIKEVDLSSFDLSKVTNCYGMFDYCNALDRIYAPKHLTATNNTCYQEWTYYAADGTAYTSLPLNLEKSILIQRYSKPAEEDSKYYTPTEAGEKQSFWNFDETGKPISYTRDRKLIRDEICELAYIDEEKDEIWFGLWCFDSRGCVVTGDYNGRHYNDSITNGYPYGIDMYASESGPREVRPSEVFLSYDYLEKYMDDLDTLCTFELSVLNFSKEFCAIVSGCFKSWAKAEFSFDKVIDEIAYQYMNDEVRCKDVLKKILEQRYDPNNVVTAANGEMKRQLKPFKTSMEKINEPLKKEISEKLKNDKKLLEEGKIDKSKYTKDYYEVLENSEIAELAYDGMIVERFVGTTMTLLGDANDLLLCFADYSDIVNFLEEIMEIAPQHSPLRRAAFDLRYEYETQFFYAFVNGYMDAVNAVDGWKKILNGIGDLPSIPDVQITGFIEQDLEMNFIYMIDFVFDTKFKAIQGMFDLIKSQDSRFDATDNIVTSVTMRLNAIQALKNAEEIVFADGKESFRDFSQYADMFFLTKELTKYQYEQMQVFYNTEIMKSRLRNECREFVDEFLGSEIDKLDTITLDSYEVMASRNDVSEFIFDKDGHTAYMLQGDLLRNTWKKISGRTYYFNADGYAVTGLVGFDENMTPINVTDPICVIPAHTYYFSEGDKSCEGDMKHQGAKIYGITELDDGYTYCFDEYTGELQRNCTITLLGRYAEVDVDGRCTFKSGRPQTTGTLPTALEIKNNKIVHKINCPVDVAAYDDAGNKVAEIINNTVVLEGNDSIKATMDSDGQKIIVADRNVPCNIKITANAEGKCSYSVTVYDESGEFESKTEYNEIDIVKDDVISSTMTIAEASDESSGMEYFTVEKGDLIVADEYMSSLQYCTVTIDYGNGTEQSRKTVEKGDFAEIAMDESMHWSDFEGWYVNDEMVSAETSFRMQINESVTVTAKGTVANLPKVDSFSLTVMDGTIGLNCYIAGIPEEVASSGKIKFGSKELSIPAPESDGTYKFSVTCAAKNMSDRYLIGVYDDEGNLIEFANANADGMYRYSVRDYIDSVKDRPDELGKLSKAMDIYGLNAQKFFGYGTVEDEATVETVDFAPYERTCSGTLPDGVTYYGSSLVLGDSIIVRHYFEAGTDVGTYTWTIDGQKVYPKAKASLYYIESGNISMYDLAKSKPISISNGKTTWSMNYSPYSYAHDVIGKSGKSELINLMYSMYWYCQAAEEYYIKNR